MFQEPGIQPYRKVAVVEQFFDIIYNVHVGLGGRSSRHAGQKRTYRTVSDLIVHVHGWLKFNFLSFRFSSFKITESYAFLPRDAVTKFLAGCQFCKKSAKPHSPSSLIADDVFTESSSEMDALNAGSGICSENSDSQLTIDSTTETKVSDNARAVLDAFVVKREDELNSLPVVDWEEAINLEKSRISSIDEKNNSSMQIIEQMSGTQQKTYFDEIYSKIQQYYGYQINNNADIKDLAASNDLLNYYTLLKTFYDQSVAAHKLGIKPSESALQTTQPYESNSSQTMKIKEEPTSSPITEPIIDLTISRPEEFQNNININIENGSTATKKSTVARTNSNELPENNITINSAGVSINVLNNSNELKISCKTTPPKKRYSVYNHAEENTSSGKMNLCEKFNQDSVNSQTTDAVTTAGDYNASKELQATGRGENKFYQKKYSTPVSDVKPITSTYLQLMRSMGFCDEDALKFDQLVSCFSFSLHYISEKIFFFTFLNSQLSINCRLNLNYTNSSVLALFFSLNATGFFSFQKLCTKLFTCNTFRDCVLGKRTSDIRSRHDR